MRRVWTQLLTVEQRSAYQLKSTIVASMLRIGHPFDVIVLPKKCMGVIMGVVMGVVSIIQLPTSTYTDAQDSVPLQCKTFTVRLPSSTREGERERERKGRRQALACESEISKIICTIHQLMFRCIHVSTLFSPSDVALDSLVVHTTRNAEWNKCHPQTVAVGLQLVYKPHEHMYMYTWTHVMTATELAL